jgi:hypothetical protein
MQGLMKTSMENITLNMATITPLDTGHLTALVRIPAAHMALATAYIILKCVKFNTVVTSKSRVSVISSNFAD